MIEKILFSEAMNDFTVATDTEYIYAEAEDRSQVKIKKTDLFQLLFQDRGAAIDANQYIASGIYRVDQGVLNLPYSGYGVLLVFNSKYIVQFYTNGEFIKGRKSPTNGETWTDWKSITFI